MSDPEVIDQQANAAETAAVVPVQTTPPPSAYRSTTVKAQETARNAYRLAKMALLIILGFILALFVFRNWDDVSFDYVFGDVQMPLAAIMLIFTALGALIGALIYWFMSRRVGKR